MSVHPAMGGRVPGWRVIAGGWRKQAWELVCSLWCLQQWQVGRIAAQDLSSRSVWRCWPCWNVSERSSSHREDRRADGDAVGFVLPAPGVVSILPTLSTAAPRPQKIPVHAWHCQQLPEADLPADPGKRHFFWIDQIWRLLYMENTDVPHLPNQTHFLHLSPTPLPTLKDSCGFFNSCFLSAWNRAASLQGERPCLWGAAAFQRYIVGELWICMPLLMCGNRRILLLFNRNWCYSSASGTRGTVLFHFLSFHAALFMFRSGLLPPRIIVIATSV